MGNIPEICKILKISGNKIPVVNINLSFLFSCLCTVNVLNNIIIKGINDRITQINKKSPLI
jgi:hypothetical protein